jgi:hypothetical protein
MGSNDTSLDRHPRAHCLFSFSLPTRLLFLALLRGVPYVNPSSRNGEICRSSDPVILHNSSFDRRCGHRIDPQRFQTRSISTRHCDEWRSESKNGKSYLLAQSQLCQAAAHGRARVDGKDGGLNLSPSVPRPYYNEPAAVSGTATAPDGASANADGRSRCHKRCVRGIGYESVSQFSREYSRFFGQPPPKRACRQERFWIYAKSPTRSSTP